MAEDRPELEQCKLLNDSILVRMDEGGNKTESGLILSAGLETEGVVAKTGPGAYTQQGEQLPMQVKVGDVVRLKNDEENYKTVRLDGDKYLFANEREIILILKSS